MKYCLYELEFIICTYLTYTFLLSILYELRDIGIRINNLHKFSVYLLLELNNRMW